MQRRDKFALQRRSRGHDEGCGSRQRHHASEHGPRFRALRLNSSLFQRLCGQGGRRRRSKWARPHRAGGAPHHIPGHGTAAHIIEEITAPAIMGGLDAGKRILWLLDCFPHFSYKGKNPMSASLGHGPKCPLPRKSPDEMARTRRASLQESQRDRLARHPKFRVCDILPAERYGVRRARWLFINLIPASAVVVALLPYSCGARTPTSLHTEAKSLSASIEVQAARALKRHFATPSAWQKKRLQQLQGLQRVLGGAFDEFGTFSCAAVARARLSPGVRKPASRFRSAGLASFVPDAGRLERIDMFLNHLTRGESVAAAWHGLDPPSSRGRDGSESRKDSPDASEAIFDAHKHARVRLRPDGDAGPTRKVTKEGNAKERHGRMHIDLRHPGRPSSPAQSPHSGEEGSGPPECAPESEATDFGGLLAGLRHWQPAMHAPGDYCHGGREGERESCPGLNARESTGLKKRLLFDDFTPRLGPSLSAVR
jgi:hypothetical protein